jgi:hypothetical protein
LRAVLAQVFDKLWEQLGFRAPDQWGTVLLFAVERRTCATMPRTRTNSSTRPAKVNTSPGRRRTMQFSSPVPIQFLRRERPTANGRETPLSDECGPPYLRPQSRSGSVVIPAKRLEGSFEPGELVHAFDARALERLRTAMRTYDPQGVMAIGRALL